VSAWEASKGKRKQPQLISPLAPLLTLLLGTGAPEQVTIAREQLSRVTNKGRIALGYAALATFLEVSVSPPRMASMQAVSDHLELLFLGLVAAFTEQPVRPGLMQELERRRVHLHHVGVHWFAEQAQAIVQQAQQRASHSAPLDLDSAAWLKLHQPQSAWERSLSLLEALAPTRASELPVAAAQSGERRLVFVVHCVKREISSEDQRTLESAQFSGAPAQDLAERFAAASESAYDLDEEEDEFAPVTRVSEQNSVGTTPCSKRC
jgi:hypothetical protein